MKLKMTLAASALFAASTASAAFTDSPSESCKADFKALAITNTKSIPVTPLNDATADFVKNGRDFRTVLGTDSIAMKAFRAAHSQARSGGQTVGFVYPNPGLFIRNSEYKLNKYVDRENPETIKGYYMSIKMDSTTGRDNYAIQMYYRYIIGEDGRAETRLIKAKSTNSAHQPNSPLYSKTYMVCEGHANPNSEKATGSVGEQMMANVYRAVDDGNGSAYFDSLPEGMSRTPMNIGEGDLTGQPLALFNTVNDDAKAHYEEFLDNFEDPEEREYHELEFEDGKYVSIERVNQIKKDGRVVGYVVKLMDFGYGAIIEDGAWITLYISVEPDGRTLKIVKRSEGTA